MSLATFQSVSHGVRMAMGDPPLALLATVDLGCPQAVGARLALDRGRGVLEARGVGQITDHVVGEQLELIRGAVREAPPEGGEELVEFVLAGGVAPCPQNADRLFAGPERATGPGVAVV